MYRPKNGIRLYICRHKRNKQKRKITKSAKSLDDYVIFGELHDGLKANSTSKTISASRNFARPFGLLTPVFAPGRLKYLPSYCRFHSHCCRNEPLDSHRPERWPVLLHVSMRILQREAQRWIPECLQIYCKLFWLPQNDLHRLCSWCWCCRCCRQHWIQSVLVLGRLLMLQLRPDSACAGRESQRRFLLFSFVVLTLTVSVNAHDAWTGCAIVRWRFHRPRWAGVTDTG